MRIAVLFIFIFLTFLSAHPQEEKEDIGKIDFQKQEKEFLEIMKKEDPEEYRRYMELKRREEKIDTVVSQYQEGKITYETAKRKLYPLFKERLRDRITNIDEEIARLEKKLSFLKKTKKNPSILIKKEIDQALGKGSEKEELFF